MGLSYRNYGAESQSRPAVGILPTVPRLGAACGNSEEFPVPAVAVGIHYVFPSECVNWHPLLERLFQPSYVNKCVVHPTIPKVFRKSEDCVNQANGTPPLQLGLWSTDIVGIHEVEENQGRIYPVHTPQEEMMSQAVGVLIEEPIPRGRSPWRVPASRLCQAA